MKLNKIQISILLMIGIVVIVNLIADQFYLRLDFTEDKQYTLSEATRDILKNLDEPVTVKAYFSENLPPQLMKTKRDFREMLVEYTRISGNMLVYDFIDPTDDEATQRELYQNQIQPLMINVREKDQMTQQQAYMAALLTKGDEKEVIPVIEPGIAMEYSLSTSIKKLSVRNKPELGLVQGHGEPPLQQLSQVSSELSVLYDIRPVTITDTARIPPGIRTLAIVRPTDTIPDFAFSQLDAFLARGGRLFVAMNRVSGDLQNGYGSAIYTGLESWLARKGIVVEKNFVIDANCASVTMQQQVGNSIHISSLAVPYIPIINNFADHPITSGLESVIMQFVSSLRYTGDSTLKFTPLVFSSGKSGTLPAPQYFNYQKQWTQADFPMKRLVLAGALEGKMGGPSDGKIVVIADGDFPIGGGSRRQQKVQEDNVNLMVNSIDWLSDDTGLIGLRTKGVSSRPIRELEDSRRAFLKWLNFLLPIILVLIYGFIRFQVRRNQRVARMEANYS